jgi:transposase
MADLLKENGALKKEIASLSVEVNTLRAIVEAMANRSASEEKVLDQKQMELAEVIAPAEDAPQIEERNPSRDDVPSIKIKSGKKPRIPLAEKLKDLPVGKTTYIIPENVKGNEELYREIKGEESVEVIFRKSSLYLHRIVKKKYIEIGEKESPPIIAQSPPRFSSSFVSSSLAIAIVLDKYSFHGTLYRMERKFLKMGIDLSRKTQSDAVERFSLWVRPLYELLQKEALSKRYLQIDETFIKYINGNLSGSSTGYFWAINAPGELAVFYWFSNRRHENARTILGDWAGLLQSDGYQAYANHAEGRAEITLPSCWAHAFRKLRDALGNDPALIRPILKQISDLYDFESEWTKQSYSQQQRKDARRERSLPIVASIKDALLEIGSNLSILPSSPTRKAASYALNRWDELEACFAQGHTHLDTNALERLFRDSAIGKKNWMFVGHPQAGDKSAIIYTLLSCCKIHNINPEPYFVSILEQLVAADGNPSEVLLESLLPYVWIKANPEALVKELPKA